MLEEKLNIPSIGEVVLYNPTELIKLEVKLEDETVWLTQPQMVQLFDSSKANISEHLKNIYAQEELSHDATVRIFRTVRQEGKRNVSRNIEYYNLDAIISVGFRVNSKAGIAFRQWANRVLKEHILRGYSINRHLLSLQERTDERFQAIEQRLDAQQEHLLGASLKDMGKSLSAITKMQMSPEIILANVK